MLPSDPRWTELDEQQVLEEAVRIAYHGLHNARVSDPMATVLSEPGLLERLTEEQEEIRNDPEFCAMVERGIRAWKIRDGDLVEGVTHEPPTLIRATLRGRTE